jgi:hypothetical protein
MAAFIGQILAGQRRSKAPASPKPAGRGNRHFQRWLSVISLRNQTVIHRVDMMSGKGKTRVATGATYGVALPSSSTGNRSEIGIP